MKRRAIAFTEVFASRVQRAVASWRLGASGVGVVAVGLSLVIACTRRPSPSEAVPVPLQDSGDASLAIEWAGCATIRKGPVCELGQKRTLTLWATGRRRGRWSIATDRGSASTRIEHDVDGGTRMTVEVPPGVKQLAIRNDDGRTEWSLRLGDAETHSEIDALLALGRSGKYEEALGRLEDLRKREPEAAHGPTDAAIARMALALGRVDRAEPAFRASIEAARAEGRLSDVVRDAAALCWALVMLQQRFADARVVLQAMKAAGEQYPEGSLWIAYNQGLLAAHTGDVRTALENYREAERKGRRWQQATLAETASMEVARQLAGVGRFDDALVILKTLPPPADPCARASLLLNVASTLMERAMRRPFRGSDPEVTNALASAATATNTCPDPHRQMLATINGAEYALAVGDYAEIARTVAAIPSKVPTHDARLTSWRADVLGRWALKRGEPSTALEHFEDQIRVARGMGLAEEEFRGQVGAGRALLALGQRNAGVFRLKTAQALLETMLRDIPLGEGRGSFLDGHDDGVRHLVSALVDGGAAHDALRVVRWTRTIELAHAARIDRLGRLSTDDRQRWDEALGRYQRTRKEIEHEAEGDWSIPQQALQTERAERQVRAERARAILDEAYRLLGDHRVSVDRPLSDPAPGEVYLAFFPAVVDWYAFAATPDAVRVQRLRDASPAAPAEASSVLALFDRELRAARRVRFFPYGASDRVDWHMVSWAGKPLLASVEVEYGLDLSSRPADPPPAAMALTALLVANPTGDLPAAVAEADSVAKELSAWNVVRFDGDRVTRTAVLDGLSRANLFHYAGHAEIQQSGRLASALLLKDTTSVELADLLAAPSVPAIVVLSACDAASTAAQFPSSMGLAQAFIAAGSRSAIAPVRAVRDTAAQDFFRAFYPALVSTVTGPQANVAAAFRKAVIDLLKTEIGRESEKRDPVGWQSFRLLVP